MQISTYSEARANLKAIIDRTIDDADITIIHRRDGENAVLMSESQYNSLMETLHLLSTPANAKSLARNCSRQSKPRHYTRFIGR